MCTIYIVVRSSGSFDEFAEVPIKAYTNEIKALKHAQEAEDFIDKWMKANPATYKMQPGDSPFDPELEYIDVGGIGYTVETLELNEEN